MSATAAPYGLIPVAKLGSGYMTGGGYEYPMPTNSSNGIYIGDAVTLNSGSISRMAATPTTTLSANTPIGIFLGCRYVDLNGQKQFAAYLPANAVTNGYTNLFVDVADDPDLLFQIQADGTVAQSNIGLNAGLNGFAAPTIVAGANPASGVTLASGTIATTSTLAVRIVKVLTPTDAYSDVICTWNWGVHRYRISTGE
jgi:hypothetical protein